KINMVEPNLKEAVKAMCKAYPGGREAMAGALGMTVTQFNNNLCKEKRLSFLRSQRAGSDGRHFQRRYWLTTSLAAVVRCWWMCHLEELDRVDLFSRAMRTSAARGQVDQIIEQALEDGVIERHEGRRNHGASPPPPGSSRRRNLPQSSRFFHAKSDASELQLLASWRVVISGDY
ncbi:YmfL family putative regulatory protein, partial [Klebsiella pneumoniae]